MRGSMSGEKSDMNDRFEVLYKEVHAAGLQKRIVYIDRETGVNYLYVQVGYGAGLTPLLNADGKPVVTPKMPNGGERFGKE